MPVGKIPWRSKWQPTPVLLSGKSLRKRQGWQATAHGVAKRRIRRDLATKQQQRERPLMPEETIRLQCAQIEKQQWESLTWEVPPLQTVISGDPADAGKAVGGEARWVAHRKGAGTERTWLRATLPLWGWQQGCGEERASQGGKSGKLRSEWGGAGRALCGSWERWETRAQKRQGLGVGPGRCWWRLFLHHFLLRSSFSLIAWL